MKCKYCSNINHKGKIVSKGCKFNIEKKSIVEMLNRVRRIKKTKKADVCSNVSSMTWIERH